MASAPAAPGFALQTTLPEKVGDYGALLSGVKLTGAARTEGVVTVRARPTPSFSAEALTWRAPAGTLSLSGDGALGGGQGSAQDGGQGGAGALNVQGL